MFIFVYYIFKKIFFIKKYFLQNNFFKKKKKRYIFLKSPHVFKKAKEHFEITSYKVLIQLKTTLNFKELFKLYKPKTIKIKIYY